MALDYYGSYTNNDLIYEAITGQTRDPTEGPNKFTPLNTPIIDASICETYAVINMVGGCLRFVSLDDGVTTPYSFNSIPDEYIVDIRAPYIYDIILPSPITATNLAAISESIIFTGAEKAKCYAIINKNYPKTINVNDYIRFDKIGYFTSTSYLYFPAINSLIDGEDSSYVDLYYIDYGKELKTDKNSIYLLSDGGTKDLNYYWMFSDITYTYENDYWLSDFYWGYGEDPGEYGFYSNNNWQKPAQSKWVDKHDTCLLYVDMSGNIMIRGQFKYFNIVNGTHGTDTDTYSYTNWTKSTLFSSYVIEKAWVYGSGIIAFTENGLLLVVGDNRNHRLTREVDDEVITTPYILGLSDLDDIVIDKYNGNNSAYSQYVILPSTLTEENGMFNIEQNSTEPTYRMSNFIQTNENVPKLGIAITSDVLGSETIRSFTSTSSKKTIYYKPEYWIPANTGEERSVTIKVGSNIPYSIENNSLDRQYDAGSDFLWTIEIDSDVLRNITSVYNEKMNILKQELDTQLTLLALNTTVNANTLGSNTTRTFTATCNNRTIYYRPETTTISAHSSNDIELVITIGSNILYNIDSNTLSKSYNPGSEYEQTITLDKTNVDYSGTIYAEAIKVLKQKLDEYITTMRIGTVVTEKMLKSNKIYSFTLDSTGETIYFRPKYTISDHSENDMEVTITIGPEIEWGV